MLRQQSQKSRFDGAAMLHFTYYKTTKLTAVINHCLAKLPKCLRSAAVLQLCYEEKLQNLP